MVPLPSASAVGTFFSNRRKTFTWVAGTVGGAYLLGKWGMQKMHASAERARMAQLENDNLSKRFILNLQDCQFTVLALLPTLSVQVMKEMDVEEASASLARIAAKAKEKERLEAEREDERRRADSASLWQKPAASEGRDAPVEEAEAADPDEVPVEQEAVNGEVTPENPEEEAVPSENGSKHDSDSSTIVAEDSVAGTAVLGKSWAEVVRNGEGPEAAEEVVKVDSAANSTEPEPEVAEPAVPERSRAEIWHEIKILSFTRTITSLYLLALLTLQTHVQLNLLGRTAYVTSVLTSLPRTSTDSSHSDRPNDRDLERAFGAGGGQEMVDFSTLPEDEAKQLERKYLTFSWWLLNRGWKTVSERVRNAVEEVIGPMPLKSVLVYGELGVLLAQIRQKIDFNPPGIPFSFLPSLFPLNPSDELLTLSAGGIPSSDLHVPPSLRTLLAETHDFLDSHDCRLVQSRLLDKLFAHLVGSLEGAFGRASAGREGATGSRFQDVTEMEAKLATILPTLARVSHLALNEVPNAFLEVMEEVPELREFSAIVYSSFDKDNLRGTK